MPQGPETNPRFLFDTATGRLERENRLPDMDHSSLIPLGELLTAKEFPFTDGSFEKIIDHPWERSHCIAMGRIILNAIQEPDKPIPAVTARHLRRMAILGLSPSQGKFAHTRSSYFASMADFQQEVGSAVNVRQAEFSAWSPERYKQHTRKLRQRFRRLPEFHDYDQAAQEGDGPNSRSVVRNAGGIGMLNEMLGYPNIRTWDDDDFIDWGVLVCKANPDIPFASYVCDILSPRNRGPSFFTARTHFGTWSKYRRLVEERLEAELTAQSAKIVDYRRMIDSGALPQEYKQLDNAALAQKAGRYLLVLDFLGSSRTETAAKLAEKSSFRAVLRERMAKRGVTDGEIETAAVANGTFDDIWPQQDYKKHLRITPNEIATYRKRRSRRRKKARASDSVA